VVFAGDFRAAEEEETGPRAAAVTLSASIVMISCAP
jgi:hypothetical protein